MPIQGKETSQLQIRRGAAEAVNSSRGPEVWKQLQNAGGSRPQGTKRAPVEQEAEPGHAALHLQGGVRSEAQFPLILES